MLLKNKLLLLVLLCSQTNLFSAAAKAPIDYSGMKLTLSDPVEQFIKSEKKKPLTDEDYKIFARYLTDDPLALITLRANEIPLKDIPQKCTYENPIYSIGECAGPRCPFSRCVNLEARENYENIVVAKLATLKQPINWLSFASGDLFLDLVIMTKFLKENPKAHVNLHALDVAYNTGGRLDRRFKDYEHKKAFYQNIFTQFRNFIRRVYPEATFTLTTHISNEAFLSKEIKTNLMTLCDAQEATDKCIEIYESLECYYIAAISLRRTDGSRYISYEEPKA